MIKDLLDEAFRVNLTMKEAIPVTNGILNKDILIDRKRKLLLFGMEYLKQDFVEVNQKFPENEISEVDLSLDFVVLKGEDYRRIVKILDNE